MLRSASAVVLGLLLVFPGCRPKKPPIATRAWLGANGGCVETPMHETSGTFACWGDAGQFANAKWEARPVATRVDPALKPQDLALGERHSCGVFDQRVKCWGAGEHGELGNASRQSASPVLASQSSEDGPKIAVAVGGDTTCIRASSGDRIRCFGADVDGAFPDSGGPIRSFVLGKAHTCVAYARTASGPETVQCRGRGVAAPKEPLLGSVVVKELAAGDEHTCALIEDGTVRCWGRNDAGQLGDGTTHDTATPVSVPDLRGVIQVVAGRRHTCALLQVGTVACWGANESHQLAIGTTENSVRPRVVVGLVGGRELSAAGDGTCARLEGGYLRCWGKNDHGQLGGGSLAEHSVPVQLQFR